MNENEKRQQRLEGKIDIPMTIDPARYFIGNIRVKDVAYTIPFIAITVVIWYILHQVGELNSSTFLFACLPPLLFGSFMWVKHPDRKNIPIITTFLWKIKYMQSKKIYEYTRKVESNMSEDIRSQLGVYNIANDCQETLDNRLVKVIELSSINIDGLSIKERDRALTSYQTFLQELPISAFPLQIQQFSKPINLNNYLEWVRGNVNKERNQYKRMFAESYISKGNEIQKAKNMVSKARYIIVSQKIGVNKEKAIEKINHLAEQVRSSLENSMIRYDLEPKILNNEELFQYVYACIDYENAQIQQSINKDSVSLPFTMPKSDMKVKEATS